MHFVYTLLLLLSAEAIALPQVLTERQCDKRLIKPKSDKRTCNDTLGNCAAYTDLCWDPCYQAYLAEVCATTCNLC